MTGLALEGIRILDCGVVQAGPWAARLLADMGAQVIRVESHIHPDVSRLTPTPDSSPGQRFWEQGSTHHEQHRNKMGITLELDTPKGQAIFKRLVAISDIVVESFPPRVMAKFGLGYEELAKVNPAIVMLSSAGYGRGGPHSDYRSYGMLIEAMSGLASLTGYVGGPPRRGSIPYPDPVCAYHGAFAIMSALIQRSRTGRGQWIDLSHYEVAVSILGEAFMEYSMNRRTIPRMGNHQSGAAPSGVYPCREPDTWVAVSVSTDEQWEGLRRALGDPAWMRDKRLADALGRRQHQDEMDARIAEWSRGLEDREAMRRLQAEGVPAGITLTPKTLMLDPHLKERGLYWLVEHSPLQERAGKRPLPGPSAKLTKTPGNVRMHAPTLGQDNEAVLHGLLGLSLEEIAELEREGVIGCDPVYGKARRPQRPMSPEEQVRLRRVRAYDPDFKQILGLE